ncbi:hypothetical protein PUS82_00335 [Cytobacillus firmus]|uniref:hypothetical protein n=1 Tax=Cytobacillus firmus TaxID=1399 RepID=UPI00237A7B39|nr:hypothetical protein [Cytobacillus firmus]MDD9309778.1 hypothetical protein [Cytobacillus firmus]
MNKSVSTFMTIALTIVTIGVFLFGIAYTLVGTETGKYETDIKQVSDKLPNVNSSTTTTP